MPLPFCVSLIALSSLVDTEAKQQTTTGKLCDHYQTRLSSGKSLTHKNHSVCAVQTYLPRVLPHKKLRHLLDGRESSVSVYFGQK